MCSNASKIPASLPKRGSQACPSPRNSRESPLGGASGPQFIADDPQLDLPKCYGRNTLVGPSDHPKSKLRLFEAAYDHHVRTRPWDCAVMPFNDEPFCTVSPSVLTYILSSFDFFLSGQLHLLSRTIHRLLDSEIRHERPQQDRLRFLEHVQIRRPIRSRWI